MLAVIESGIFLYVLAALAGLGIVSKLVCTIRYSRMERQAEDVPAAKDTYIKLWKNKFENTYRINKGMNDAGLFVERCINQCKMLGILLTRWDRLNRVLCGISLLLGLTAVTIGERGGLSTALVLDHLLVTLSICGLMLFVEFFCETGDKRQRIGLDLEEYFVNTLSHRLQLSVETVTAESEPTPAQAPVRTADEMRSEPYEKLRRDEPRKESARDSLKESLERIAASREPEEEDRRSKRSRNSREEDVRLIEEILREYLR